MEERQYKEGLLASRVNGSGIVVSLPNEQLASETTVALPPASSTFLWGGSDPFPRTFSQGNLTH